MPWEKIKFEDIRVGDEIRVSIKQPGKNNLRWPVIALGVRDSILVSMYGSRMEFTRLMGGFWKWTGEPRSVPAEDYELVRADELQVGDVLMYGYTEYTVLKTINTSNPCRIEISVKPSGMVTFSPDDLIRRVKRAPADDVLHRVFAEDKWEPKQIDDWPGPPCKHCGAGTYVGLLGVECKNGCKQ